jgi:hypothetical protein
MILLQDHDSFMDIAALSPESGALQWRKREEGNRTRTSGWIGRIGSESVSLYKRDNKLRVHVRGRECDADRTDVLLTPEGARCRFELRCEGESFFDVTYAPADVTPPSNHLLTAFEEDENYDFALLVFRILTNPERMRVCLETWA